MGGSTISNDYGPSSSQVGFLYSVDLAGNWRWGNFYFNSSAITDISGCSLSSNNEQIVAMGVSLGKPVIMLINTDGKVENLITAEANLNEARTIKTYGAVLLENSSEPSVYFSYLEADKLRLVSLRLADKQAFPRWNFEFEDLSVITQPDNFYRQKLPQFLVEDPLLDMSKFVMGG